MDINSIRKRLNQLQTTNNRTSNLWKPQPGKQIIRVLPYKHNKDNPFIELFFHFGLNNKTYLSPTSFGRPDPIEEFAQKLKTSGNREEYQMARKLESKMRTFAPVVVRGEEGQGVRFWGFGKTVYQSLLNIMLDEDYGDITDPEDGRDVKVVCTKAPGRQWATTEVRPRGKQSPLSEDTSRIDSYTSSMPSLDDMYTCKSYEELEKIVNDWLNDDDSGDDGTSRDFGSSTQSTTTNTSSTSTKSDGQKYKSLDEAFADLEDL